jgi:hypothetical protein
VIQNTNTCSVWIITGQSLLGVDTDGKMRSTIVEALIGGLLWAILWDDVRLNNDSIDSIFY